MRKGNKEKVTETESSNNKSNTKWQNTAKNVKWQLAKILWLFKGYIINKDLKIE